MFGWTVIRFDEICMDEIDKVIEELIREGSITVDYVKLKGNDM